MVTKIPLFRSWVDDDGRRHEQLVGHARIKNARLFIAERTGLEKLFIGGAAPTTSIQLGFDALVPAIGR